MARYGCPDCDYVYDEATGDDYNGYPAGMKFADLPEDFVCPDCAVCDKESFERLDG